MPSPKDGTAGTAVAPADPVEALEADDANPGEVEQALTPVTAALGGSKTTIDGGPAVGG